METWLADLEGVMGTIEAEKEDQMEEIRETPEWQAAQAALTNAQAF